MNGMQKIAYKCLVMLHHHQQILKLIFLSACFLSVKTGFVFVFIRLIDRIWASLISCQVKYIYLALLTIQIVSKLLHSINQNNWTVLVYYWKKKTIKFG